MTDPKKFAVPPNTTKVESAFGLEFHQIAMYTNYLAEPVDILQWLGFTDWHFDNAQLAGTHQNVPCVITARMAFNYQLIQGKELEFVSYLNHPDPRYRRESLLFISHISAYVDSVDEFCARVARDHTMQPYHRFTTTNHTNPRVAGKKYFREAIFATPDFGFNLKVIEKVIQ